MDTDVISYEAMLAAQEAAKAAYWSMVFTAIGAASSIITVLLAVYAAHVARREISGWKQQQKLLQLVRLKRAVFAYRQKLEANIYRAADNKKINEILRDELQPLLAEIFQELVIAGLDSEECEQTKIFRQLMHAHNLHRDEKADWNEVYECAGKLQQSIKVRL
ncbi:hypothetical protein ACY5GL_002857 [Cronobacter malonaticus]